jgi:outer membrane protein assembly factor BamD (BamD/ComL family)
MKNTKYFLFSCVFILSLTPCYSKEKKIVKNTEKSIKDKSAYDYYHEIVGFFQNKAWDKTIVISKDMLARYKESPFNSEVYYYLGVSYFNVLDFDMSNFYLGKYLKNETTPKFFEEAIECKFNIAEKFYEGARKHIFGLEKLPKVLPAKEDALDIYDEIITALPRHDLTAKSLFKKGILLLDFEDFKPSVESFEILIRRFPKHYLAADAYLGIQAVYLKQSEKEFPDPDILELAHINLHKFTDSFPGESRLSEAEKLLSQTEDCFAKELFETGSFYERTHKLDAAVLYYSNILSNYPNSSFAAKAKKSVDKLEKMQQRKK